MTDSARVGVVRGVMAAWGDHDVEGVLQAMDEDIEWHYHVGSPPVRGVAAMGKLLGSLAGRQLSVNWRITRIAEAEDAVMVEGVDDHRNADGKHIRVPYMGVFEFSGDDRIVGWRDYFEMSTLQACERGEPTPPYLDGLIGSD